MRLLRHRLSQQYNPKVKNAVQLKMKSITRSMQITIWIHSSGYVLFSNILYPTDTSTHTSSHHISKRVGRGSVERQDRKSPRRRKGRSLSTAYMVITLMYLYRLCSSWWTHLCISTGLYSSWWTHSCISTGLCSSWWTHSRISKRFCSSRPTPRTHST